MADVTVDAVGGGVEGVALLLVFHAVAVDARTAFDAVTPGGAKVILGAAQGLRDQTLLVDELVGVDVVVVAVDATVTISRRRRRRAVVIGAEARDAVKKKPPKTASPSMTQRSWLPHLRILSAVT